MKVQLKADTLRVRIDEAELERLLAREAVALKIAFGSRRLLALELCLAASLDFDPGATWRLWLPDDVVRGYVATLPRREAQSFALVPAVGPALRIEFEVDVRDSIQHRGPRVRAPA